MGLAPRRQVRDTTSRYALNEVSERGKICAIIPGTTSAGEVTVSASPTGVGINAIGVLLDDVEDLNFDRHPEYRQRSVVDQGSIVSIAQKAEVETDQITGSPVAGNSAYLNVNGTVSPTQLQDGLGNNAPLVGKFLAAPDANGFAAVHVDL